MDSLRRRLPLLLLALLGIVALGFLVWRALPEEQLPAGFASGNGRIEATEIDLASRTAGRLEELLVREGDLVERGDLLARMDTRSLRAALHEAEARARQARVGVDTALRGIEQARAEQEAARAVVAQREAELEAARKQLARTEELAGRDAVPASQVDNDQAGFEAARAAVAAARAQVEAAGAALGRAEADAIAAEAAVEAAEATVERLTADLEDGVLRAPRDGRVQYRVAQPGEVLSAGGVVLNMVDLTDVYMTIFLPTAEAGRVALGAEARIVLDAAPDLVFPAEVTFVASVAQFTPKTVETEEERAKLMFRVRASLDPDLLRQYLRQVKTGLPGLTYVRLDPDLPWPEELRVQLPE